MLNPLRCGGSKTPVLQETSVPSFRCRLPSGALLTLVPVSGDFGREHPRSIPRRTVALAVSRTKPHPLRCVRRQGRRNGMVSSMGSTIIVFAPHGVALGAKIREGDRIRMGQALMEFDALRRS